MPAQTDSAATILVIEDDDHIAQVLSFILERQGYQVILATDGLKARELIESRDQPPCLVLLDVMLPYIDGFEVVQIVRARAGWENTPVVMLTAKTMEQDIVRALDAGANDYIIKPFQPSELLARIRRFLRSRA